jgi:hypothetical protein
MPALEVVQRDTVQPDFRALHLLDGPQDRLDPLGRRVASEHQGP